MHFPLFSLLGQLDLNQRMQESKSCALPLGDDPIIKKRWVEGFEPSASRATIWRANQLRYIHHMPYTMTKAGDGNRTHVFSLEG